MARKRHDESSVMGIRARASAKNRAREAGAKLQGRLPPLPSANTHEIGNPEEAIVVLEGEHPVDALRKLRSKLGTPTRLRLDCENERSPYRSNARRLDSEMMDDIGNHLKEGFTRRDTERLMKLGKDRIKQWVRAGKKSSDAVQEWHHKFDSLILEGRTDEDALEIAGEAPELDRYAVFHAEVLSAEAAGTGSLKATILSAAINGDWKAAAWLLKVRDGKTYGRYAEFHPVDEEAETWSDGALQTSPVDALARILNEMGAKAQPVEIEEP